MIYFLATDNNVGGLHSFKFCNFLEASPIPCQNYEEWLIDKAIFPHIVQSLRMPAIHTNNFIDLSPKPLNQMTANKARAACNQHLHNLSLSL